MANGAWGRAARAHGRRDTRPLGHRAARVPASRRWGSGRGAAGREVHWRGGRATVRHGGASTRGGGGGRARGPWGPSRRGARGGCRPRGVRGRGATGATGGATGAGARDGERKGARREGGGVEREGEGRCRERGRGELTSGSKSGDHRLQNLGHHGEREMGEGGRLLHGRIE
jgi:hypothetical protein